jgi:hypothetical protein
MEQIRKGAKRHWMFGAALALAVLAAGAVGRMVARTAASEARYEMGNDRTAFYRWFQSR